jgi:hypothetical protein
MSTINLVGMAVYTYGVLEESLDPLWQWLEAIERWSGRQYAELNYSPRYKENRKVWPATTKNRAKLLDQLRDRSPWTAIQLGWPEGAMEHFAGKTKGLNVVISSSNQLGPGMDAYRNPSYICLLVHPQALSDSTTGIAGVLDLGIQAWSIISGVYGFVDVETRIPLHDHLMRNIAHLYSNLVPKGYEREFLRWVRIGAHLDRRVWQAFWANFLGAGHMQQMGGLKRLRQGDPYSRHEEQAYEIGKRRLQECGCSAGWYDLSNKGVLLTLSESPLNWLTPEVQTKRERLQQTFGQVAVGPWDDINLPALGTEFSDTGT